jgi:UDP-N-acetylglucosamine 2-epimerase
MSGAFFNELKLKAPHYNLGISGGSHGAMTGRMLDEIERILIHETPDLVVVFGDTNSTLAGALAASKLHIPVAHVEAGLRSFNKKMPEEINRILTDHVSSLLFCPTDIAVSNLKNEGLIQCVVNVGDIMYDAVRNYSKVARENVTLDKWSLKAKRYVLCTIHRAENTDDLGRLENIFSALNEISNDIQIVLPLHPRTKAKLKDTNKNYLLNKILVIEPVSYLEMIRLEIDALTIITDSGGVQKEAFFYKVPCLTIRDETEWIETVQLGWNKVCGTNCERIVGEWRSMGKLPRQNGEPYGDGHAAEKIVQYIADHF